MNDVPEYRSLKVHVVMIWTKVESAVKNLLESIDDQLYLWYHRK